MTQKTPADAVLYLMPKNSDHPRMETDIFFRAGAIMRWFDNSQETIREALTLLAAVQGGKGGWQLIKTAPKDGTEVIGIVAGVAASVCRMKFRKAKNRGDIDMWIEPVWSEEIGPTTTMKNPTHWMPVQAAESYAAPSAAEVIDVR